jgi:hypothetical protein
MASNPATGYRSASALAFWATLLSIALGVFNALTALSLAGQIQLLEVTRSGVALPPALAEAQDARQRLLGALELTFGIAASVAFLAWVYRANRNARALGAEGMAYSPGWSVGWFFVPVANLFVPYWVLRELWRASTPALGTHWRDAAVSPVVGVWWAVCVVRGVIQYSPLQVVTGRWQLTELPTFGRRWLDGFLEFSWGLLLGELVEIAAGVLSVVVVLSITRLQERRRVLLASEATRQLAATG